MIDATTTWKKSSFCSDSVCVEVARVGVDLIAVRDGKCLSQPPLFFGRESWSSFLDGILSGEYDFDDAR
jgi:hypothetical protein